MSRRARAWPAHRDRWYVDPDDMRDAWQAWHESHAPADDEQQRADDYQREQIASANSGSERINGNRG